MFKRLLSALLVGLLINFAAPGTARAGQGADEQARRVEKVRAAVRKLGVGEEARVEVRLADGRRVKGHVREAGEDGFVVVDAKTGAATNVVYSQVAQVKGANRLTAAKVGITIAKGVAVFAAVGAAFTLFGFILLSQMD